MIEGPIGVLSIKEAEIVFLRLFLLGIGSSEYLGFLSLGVEKKALLIQLETTAMEQNLVSLYSSRIP